MGVCAGKLKQAAAAAHSSPIQLLKLKFDPDEKWQNLYRERSKNHLYKWVGDGTATSDGGRGELIDLFRNANGDDAPVHKFAELHIRPMLYNEGLEPHRVTAVEFAKWRRAQTSNIQGSQLSGDVGPIDESYFIDHKAQWKLNKRGLDGETLIHLLLNRDEPECMEIVKILGLGLLLVHDVYIGDELFGQSALHLAISYDDFEMIELLLKLGADVNARATGRFFQPEDQKRSKPAKQTDYVGYAYFGEYPLAFAACFGNKDAYDALLKFGADPNLKDSFGNTVLHMCVIHYSTCAYEPILGAPAQNMYTYAVRHWNRTADTSLVNAAGYTPLTLAAKLGRKDIFEEMLELMKLEFWRFSDMTCSAYPLDALDTIRPDGSTNWESTLMTIINGNSAGHLEMVGGDVVQRLMAEKWNAYAARKFYERAALTLLHLLSMSVAVYTRPSNPKLLTDYTLWTNIDYVRATCEVFVLCGCVFFVLQQQTAEIRAQSVRVYVLNLRNAPDKAIFLLSNVFIMLVPFMRMLG